MQQTAEPIAIDLDTNLSASNVSGRIKIKESLLDRAKNNDIDAIKTMFQQFLPTEETIFHGEYYGYFGFWFVGFHSFSCLTEKRISVLRVGPFKKVIYLDGFYENMTSGGVYQPSKFWLYFFQLIGIFSLIALFFLIFTFLSELIFNVIAFIVAATITVAISPFILNFITIQFYYFNPCGLACWIRERKPVFVFVSRDKMLNANKLYRKWSYFREERRKYVKNKFK